MRSETSFGMSGFPEMVVIVTTILVPAFVCVIPFLFLCRKAGFNPWLSLIAALPAGPVILAFILAFARWPARPEEVSA